MKPFFVFISLALLCIAACTTASADSSDITIVYIDEKTVEEIGPYPLSRDRYADFIDSIYSNYVPKCLYLNLLITQYQKGASQSDSRLLSSVVGKPNLFFSAMTSGAGVNHDPYAASRFNEITYNHVWMAQGALFPLAKIARSGAFTSISDVGLNKRGLVEGVPSVVRIDGNNYLSTPLFLSITYLGLTSGQVFRNGELYFGNRKIKTDKQGWYDIDFSHNFTSYSYHEILTDSASRDDIDGRIVMLGLDVPALERHLEVGRNRKITGVEVIANATQTLIDLYRP
ncbi:MAG: CHASE2 domain-containing protein [Spirochaetes bacterium]|nr:CHASE2 domain-containing protein [Spirochaetota bacterium]